MVCYKEDKHHFVTNTEGTQYITYTCCVVPTLNSNYVSLYQGAVSRSSAQAAGT